MSGILFIFACFHFVLFRAGADTEFMVWPLLFIDGRAARTDV